MDHELRVKNAVSTVRTIKTFGVPVVHSTINVASGREGGSLLIASASGSQLGPLVSRAGHVILVIGAQKIVSDVAAITLLAPVPPARGAARARRRGRPRR